MEVEKNGGKSFWRMPSGRKKENRVHSGLRGIKFEIKGSIHPFVRPFHCLIVILTVRPFFFLPFVLPRLESPLEVKSNPLSQPPMLLFTREEREVWKEERRKEEETAGWE